LLCYLRNKIYYFPRKAQHVEKWYLQGILQLVRVKIATNYLPDCVRYFDMNRNFYVLFKKDENLHKKVSNMGDLNVIPFLLGYIK